MDTPVQPALEEMVRDAYSRIAQTPDAADAPFPTGRSLAEGVGYPPELLDALPLDVVERFCGVAAVPVFAELTPGERVLDLGCGAGMDSQLAFLRGAVVTGLDFSAEMLDRARQGRHGAEFVHGQAWETPFADDSFDVVLMNGLLNLNPRRTDIVAEVARLLRPGGRLYAAELVLVQPLDAQERGDFRNWFG